MSCSFFLKNIYLMNKPHCNKNLKLLNMTKNYNNTSTTKKSTLFFYIHISHIVTYILLG